MSVCRRDDLLNQHHWYWFEFKMVNDPHCSICQVKCASIWSLISFKIQFDIPFMNNLNRKINSIELKIVWQIFFLHDTRYLRLLCISFLALDCMFLTLKCRTSFLTFKIRAIIYMLLNDSVTIWTTIDANNDGNFI